MFCSVASKSGLLDLYRIFAEWHRVEVKLTLAIGLYGLRVCRLASLQSNLRVGHRTMLRIVNDSAYSSENRGQGTSN